MPKLLREANSQSEASTPKRLQLGQWVSRTDVAVLCVISRAPTVETFIRQLYSDRTTLCLDVVREEKVLERGAPSVTEKFFVITSRVSPSPLSVVSLVVVV